MNAQVIKTPEGENLIVITAAEYEALVALGEDATDIAAIKRFEAALADGEEELIPSEIVDRLLDGDNRIRVWREFRGLSMQELASSSGLGEARVAAIESDSLGMTIAELQALAPALRVDPEDLLPARQEPDV